MAFSNVKLNDVLEKYNLIEDNQNIFSNLQKVTPSEWLLDMIRTANEMPLNSEKAKSEFIIAPILLEVWKNRNKQFSIFSGEAIDLEVEWLDKCSFVLSKMPKTLELESPFFIINQPQNENIRLGIGQCVLQMYAAQKFNEIKNKPIKVIYGCVTTGDDWQFIKLEKNTVTFDNKRFYLSEVDKILGVFQKIVNQLD